MPLFLYTIVAILIALCHFPWIINVPNDGAGWCIVLPFLLINANLYSPHSIHIFHLSIAAHYLYETEEACVDRLKQFAEFPDRIPMPLDIPFSRVDWTYTRDSYKSLFSAKPISSLVNNHCSSNHANYLSVPDDDWNCTERLYTMHCAWDPMNIRVNNLRCSLFFAKFWLTDVPHSTQLPINWLPFLQ